MFNRTFDEPAADATAAQVAENVMENAWYADEFGEGPIRAIVRFLMKKGHAPREAAAILCSKHLRWSDDMEGRGNGKTPNSAAFIRYYERREGKVDWIAEGRQMADETY